MIKANIAPPTVQAGSAPLEEQLQDLFSWTAPAWPLASAVACNPLQGLENRPFPEAARLGQAAFGGDCLPGFWQLRQAHTAGELSSEALARAVEQAEQLCPDTLKLGTETVHIGPLLTALWESYEDARYTAGQLSPQLEAALPHLAPQQAWQAQQQAVNREVIIWLAPFLDEGQAAWSMPYREQGFFGALKRLLKYERRFAEHRAFLADLPDQPLSALALLLGTLKVAQADQELFLRGHLLALPGWAAFIRWRSEQTDYGPQQACPIDLTGYLAARLLLAYLLPSIAGTVPTVPKQWKRLSDWAAQALPGVQQVEGKQWAQLLKVLDQASDAMRLHLLRECEGHFRLGLAKQIQQEAPYLEQAKQKPSAQLVFCIDVRSEPFRRQLEAVGDYETFGFAGFFGLPIAIETVLGQRIKSLPVLLSPAHELREQAGQGCAHQLPRHREGKQLLKDLRRVYKSLKYNLATPFAAVEALGLAAGVITVGRSLVHPMLMKLRAKGRALFSPPIDLVPDIKPENDWGIPEESQLTYAANALRMMGLTTGFAPLVLFCGHGSETENNPYAAALDCGACGGQHGGPNAAALARILNQPWLRERLRGQGIDIPQETLFVGAEHNTTTDGLRLLDLPVLEEAQQQALARLKTDLRRAQQGNLAARAKQLGANTPWQLLRRSTDWSEVRPEWGLAGNAGFIVAPRQLTERLDLKGRCFLHSYDWKQDEGGQALETILTAPLVVAQWINSQYFFSTVDNVAFGSGSKVTHNVVGKFGIMQGNGSDLMHGLPLQSVLRSDNQLYHRPLRLGAVVMAPLSWVQSIIDRHEILQKLLFNEWVGLMVYDPEEKATFSLGLDGAWTKQAL